QSGQCGGWKSRGNYLLDLERAFERTGLFYVRFMDDIVVLAPTRWRLRAAVRQVQQTLTTLGLATHPDKTFIGRVERGFDFLGYHITPHGLSVARGDAQAVRRTGHPALRARAGPTVRISPARVIRATLG